jgi:hypothetical protein
VIPAGTAVLYAPRAGLPLYGRALAGDCPRGLLRIRLTADHERAPKGAALYVLRSRVRLRRPGRHASGVRVWGPVWLRPRGGRKVKGG